MEGTVTARDKEGNVLLIGRFSDLASRKALEIFIKALYGIQHHSTTITPTVDQQWKRRLVWINRWDWVKMIIGSLIFLVAVITVARYFGK